MLLGGGWWWWWGGYRCSRSKSRLHSGRLSGQQINSSALFWGKCVCDWFIAMAQQSELMDCSQQKLPGLIMGLCPGTGAVSQPPDSPGSVLFSSRPSHLSPRRAPSKAEAPELRLPQLCAGSSPPTHTHTASSQQRYGLSQFFGDSSRAIPEIIWIRQGIYFYRQAPKKKKKAARLLNTKQTAAPPCQTHPSQ